MHIPLPAPHVHPSTPFPKHAHTRPHKHNPTASCDSRRCLVVGSTADVAKVRKEVPRAYITERELASLSSYMRGRLTLDKVDARHVRPGGTHGMGRGPRGWVGL